MNQTNLEISIRQPILVNMKHTHADIYDCINRYLIGKKNPIIFELGAHLGEDTAMLFNHCKGDNVRYVAFEPSSANVKHILHSLNIPSNIHFSLVHAAISDTVGYTTFYKSGGVHPNGNENTMAGSIRKPKTVLQEYPFIDFQEKENVRTITIDKYCNDNDIDKIDFIWSDIQGCEYDMIVGAKNMLPNIGMMLLEYSPTELYEGQKGLDDIISLLNASCWEVIVQTTEDVLVINRCYQ